MRNPFRIWGLFGHHPRGGACRPREPFWSERVILALTDAPGTLFYPQDQKVAEAAAAAL
jgi:hypothetical protein